MLIGFSEMKKDFFSVPEGVWFQGDFTVESFVYLPSDYSKWCTVMDFGNGEKSDNVVFALSAGWPFLSVFVGYEHVQLFGNGSIPKNTWVHLAGTLKGNTAVIYKNGIAVSKTLKMGSPRNVERKMNFFGKSNWESKGYTTACYRDIKLWQRALSKDEVKQSMLGKLPADSSLLGYWKANLYNEADPSAPVNPGEEVPTLVAPIRYVPSTTSS